MNKNSVCRTKEIPHEREVCGRYRSFSVQTELEYEESNKGLTKGINKASYKGIAWNVL